MQHMANIVCEDHGPVRLITINRPDQMNSLDFEANRELVQVWREFAADESARVAVITGAGKKAFCAGADLKTYTMNFAQRPGYEFRMEFTDGPGFGGITRGLEIPKPTIAAINGFAISGGLELALACDIRFCSTNAEFALQDVRWGFHACDGGLIRLPQIVGLGNAMEIVLSGERITSQHALRIGLVNAIYPDSDLLEKTLRYADMLASRAPLAQRFAKDVMKRAVGLPIDEALRLESRSFHDLGHTKDLAEGTASFREKRPPRFSGY
jgi:enoyl-CoA hydratase/carnithine racemase